MTSSVIRLGVIFPHPFVVKFLNHERTLHRSQAIKEHRRSSRTQLGDGCPVCHGMYFEFGRYALCTSRGLALIDRHLRAANEPTLDDLRGMVGIGLHWQVEVTDAPGTRRPIVSQASCSALPVAYTRIATHHRESFARLVLAAAYEATLLAGVLHRDRGGSNVVLLTRVGGGAFGNEDQWINDAIQRAIECTLDYGLDVRGMSYGEPSAAIVALKRKFA